MKTQNSAGTLTPAQIHCGLSGVGNLSPPGEWTYPAERSWVITSAHSVRTDETGSVCDLMSTSPYQQGTSKVSDYDAPTVNTPSVLRTWFHEVLCFRSVVSPRIKRLGTGVLPAVDQYPYTVGLPFRIEVSPHRRA